MISVHDLRRVSPDTAAAWADHIAANMRQSDVEEVAALSGSTPSEAIHTSLALSTVAFAVESSTHGIVAMFGAAPHALPGVGIAWMLGTDGILAENRAIARETRRYIAEVHSDYWMLWNYIDGRNAVSMRWLRWGGFKPLVERTGPEGQPIITFARTVHDV